MARPEDDRRTKIQHPETAYGSPDEILKDKTLTPDDKKQALENWKRDAFEELQAADEGMMGSDEELEETDREIQQVIEAEEELDRRDGS